MEILCFGVSKDIVQSSKLDLSSNSIGTVGALKAYLLNTYPEFRKYNSFIIAVNQVYADDSQDISSNDEIAIIPPVSGG